MMKNIDKVLLMVLSAMLIMVSCTEDFEELNTPPSSVTSIDPGLQLSYVQRGMIYDSENNYWKTNTMQYGAWVQHWGVPDQNQASANYIPMQDWFNSDWNWHYELLKELSQIETLLLNSVEDRNKDNPEIRSKLAISKILNVYIAERLTALVGDVPYSEAVTGLSGNTTPVYDPQEELYPALLDTLDLYIGKLNSNDFTYGSADFFYGGDTDQWMKFGNSLKLRIGMRMKYSNPSAAEAAVTDAMNSPLLSSNDDSAVVPTSAGGASDFQVHPILAIFRTLAGKSMLGETLINTLQDKNDPRLTLIAEPTANSKENPPLEYRGLPHGMTPAEYDQIVVGDYSYPSSSIFVNEDLARPMKVFMYHEVEFLKAEAALEGWGATPAEAQGFLQSAIQAELSRFPYEVPQADIDTYIASEGVLSGTTEEQLEQIMTQKWLALFDQEMQSYIEWRRTGYPLLDPGNNQGVTNGNIPRRGLYAQDEQSLNSENYQAVLTSQGPDELMTRIWIDANTNDGQQ
ncbi:SusD/RagB family nutrient-binding outer membrane lipoprotein [Rhodohalobacter sp. 8-1]|uniref:SusD/RagB family nutrient-binding outer membrane lipoprotein n=1 Tax=Rhodohalobacter sp. 8-1 TaxID=3131972 RepID=UPI0030EDFE5E